MKREIKSGIKKLMALRPEKDNSKISFSQSGEDLIMDFVLNMLKIEHPSYLDIGAHHSSYLSNTYFFYSKGSSGVCVEPDPVLASEIKKNRPRDVVLPSGVAFNEDLSETDFFLMDPPTLNTMSKEEVEMYQQHYPWSKLKETIKIELISISEIMEKYFKGNTPNIVSIDTEGVDLEIVNSIDFDIYQPEVFCIETAVYSGKNQLSRNDLLIKKMRENGYFVYADTFINTIFVNKKAWSKSGNAKLRGYA